MDKNPFVLPGFGQSGPLGENPILASMEMMRHAWEGLASSGSMQAPGVGTMMSVDELDKRISDLRAVENWLRLNLSMLTSTIQGLEVQRATMATLKSFVDTGMMSMGQPMNPSAFGGQGQQPAQASGQTQKQKPSPLEEALGMRPSGSQTEPVATPESQTSQPPQPQQSGQARSDAQAPGAGQSASSASEPNQPDQADVLGAAATAAQGWWNLMQQQFQSLAAATAATAASAEEAMTDLAQAGEAVVKSAAAPAKAAKKTAAKRAAKSATKAAAKKAAKASSKKTAAKSRAGGTAAKKSAARSTARKTPR